MVIDWLFKIPIAHRGLHGQGTPENSMAAFLRAAEKGYPAELDVRLTRDERVVVFHDDSLERMTGKPGFVRDYDYKDIKDLTLQGTNERIPLLSELFAAAACRLPLLIEIKNESPTDRRTEDRLLEALSGYKGGFALKSFNPWGIKYCKEKRPDYFCGLLSDDGFKPERVPEEKKEFVKSLVFGKNRALDFVSYNAGLIPDGFTEKLNPEIPLICWTVRNLEAYHKVKPKVKNVVFEGFTPD